MSIQKRQIQTHSAHPPDLNLHLIAISNLQDPNRILIRFMMRKYKTPPKPIMEYTAEEIRVEMLEDYYERHPQEAERLMDSVRQISLSPQYNVEEGTTAEYEKDLKEKNKKFFERNTFDLSKWKSDKPLTKEEEEQIIANLGRDKTKRPKESHGLITEEEFEDIF